MFLLKGNNPKIDRTKVEIDIERNNKKVNRFFYIRKNKIEKEKYNKNIKE